MVKNKNNMAIWGSRIKKDASTLFQKVGNSIDIDKKLFQEDILGSIVHVEMLFRQKIISFKIKNKIIFGKASLLQCGCAAATIPIRNSPSAGSAAVHSSRPTRL